MWIRGLSKQQQALLSRTGPLWTQERGQQRPVVGLRASPSPLRVSFPICGLDSTFPPSASSDPVGFCVEQDHAGVTDTCQISTRQPVQSVQLNMTLLGWPCLLVCSLLSPQHYQSILQMFTE